MVRRLRSFSLLLPTTVLACLAAVIPATSAKAGTGVQWTSISSSFSSPVQVTSPPGATGRLFVAEKAGLVRVWRNGSVAATPFLDLRGAVRTDGEGGLLSIAFNRTAWNSQPYVFVAFTNLAGSLQVNRYRVASPTAATVDYRSVLKIFAVSHPSHTNHYGGQLIYRPDNTLLVTTGDGGGAGDAPNNALSLRSLLGKVLRVDPWHRCTAAGSSYCIPRNNPFATSTSIRREIYHVGLRNPWRVSIDPATDYLWIGDVGQDRYEEIDVAAAKPRNFGWSCREANATYNSARCSSRSTYIAPVTSYSHASGDSVIGGFVYRGSSYPGLAGRYLFGDFGSGNVWTYGNRTMSLQAQRLDGLTSFGEGDGRELYAVTYDGRLWRMSYS